MTVSEIRSNIRYNENLIEEFSKEKQNIENQINELEKLNEKYEGLRSKFGARQQQRQNKLSLFLSSNLQNSILEKYYNGMNALLVGKEFNNAYDGLAEAKQKIRKKINQLDQQRDDCIDKLTYRKGRLVYWKARLRDALAEADK